jgi:uncharacterized protein YigE (DUF2233 family)
MLPRWLLALIGCAAVSPLTAAEHVEYEGALYHLWRVPRSEQSQLQLVWLGRDQKPIGSFSGLQKELAAQGKEIQFAMNAGIFERGPKPCGLTISEGQEQVPLNLRRGEGNFYLLPNGVFYVDQSKGAGVMEAAEFGQSGIKPRLATQSGPLLLRNGVTHPAFKVDSPNKRLRNAVGVHAASGEIIFVMSDRLDRVKGRVTFHQLARFFLHLGCKDALYLDGDISDMVVEPLPEAALTPNTFAAMFVIAR